MGVYVSFRGNGRPFVRWNSSPGIHPPPYHSPCALNSYCVVVLHLPSLHLNQFLTLVALLCKLWSMLGDLLAAKLWFGFDLDDTLHEFRKASRSASRCLFANIESGSGIAAHLLEKDYAAILETATRDAFVDGRSSDEYRQERFQALLDGRRLQYPQCYLTSLVEQYKIALGNALQLKPGALQLLQYLKQLGKKVIIITEGPSDAQIWTVQQLGLEPYVDVLVTTNEVGKSKVNGLFTEVLHMHNISPEDLAYFGDNQARDIVPTTQIGVLAIHYNEDEGFMLETVDNCHTIQPTAESFLRVDSLAKIQRVMEAHEVQHSTSSIQPTERTNKFPMHHESFKEYPN